MGEIVKVATAGRIKGAPKGFRFRQEPGYVRRDPTTGEILNEDDLPGLAGENRGESLEFLKIKDEDLLLEALPDSESRRAQKRATKSSALKRRGSRASAGRVPNGGGNARRKTLLSG